ncbi:hypothetical protein CCP3SC1AL1_2210008 [Gammaproteobacteria bacterium]
MSFKIKQEKKFKHGIAIKEKDTNNIVDFIECPYGTSALRVLSGVRRNLDNKRYKASEEIIEAE